MKAFFKALAISFCVSTLLLSCDSADLGGSMASTDSITMLIDKVVRWQEANPNYVNDGKYGWGTSTYYIGLMSVYATTGDIRYLELSKEWANSNNWKLKSNGRDADDHAAGQVFLEIYQSDPQPEYINHVQSVMDSLLFFPERGREDWFWLDALFMSPPVLSALGDISLDSAYRNTLHSMWWDVVDYLIDDSDSLFYRDANFFNRKNENGNKIYWSRGNGWALAGLVRVHKSLPRNDPYLQDYENLLRTVGSRLMKTQNHYGLWYPNIVDPLSFPFEETSGSSLILYALCYGYNQGILGEEFKGPILNAWSGLERNVGPDGRLSWVQASAGGPTEVFEEDTYMYGTGAFLLAASEIMKIDD